MSSPGPFSYKPPSKTAISKTLNVTHVRDIEDSEEYILKPRDSCIKNEPNKPSLC